VTRAGNGWTVTPVGIDPRSATGLSNDWAWNAIFTSVDKEIYGKADGVWELGDGRVQGRRGRLPRGPAHPPGRRLDRGCTLGANGACWTSPTMPYSAVNPTPYPSGYNADALGVPGLLLPIAGDPARIATVINAINDGVHGPASVIHTPQNYYWLAAFKVKELDYSAT